jgi:hypothetical protein
LRSRENQRVSLIGRGGRSGVFHHGVSSVYFRFGGGGAMRVLWLAWYICGACLLLALLASAITYHPQVQHLGVVLPAVFGAVALLAGGAAVGIGRLPPTHRLHRSKPLWAGMVAVAIAATLLLVSVA